MKSVSMPQVNIIHIIQVRIIFKIGNFYNLECENGEPLGQFNWERILKNNQTTKQLNNFYLDQ